MWPFRRPRTIPRPPHPSILTDGSAGGSRPSRFLEADLQDRIKAKGPELLPCRPADDWAPPDYDERRRLRDERRLLGFATGPPLFSLFRRAPSGGGPPFIRSNRIGDYRGRAVRLQGLVATARQAHMRDGRPVQFVTLEDEYGLAEVTLFPGECPAVPYLTMGPYTATGVVEEQYGVCTIAARSFERPG